MSLDAPLYKVETSKELGRYLVASQDIEERTVIICEQPIVCGPADDDSSTESGSNQMCLGCSKRMSSNSRSRCGKCGWPVCGLECENTEVHAQNECLIFSSKNVAYPPCRHSLPVVNKSVLVLRTLLLKSKYPSLWEKVILKLEHHTEIRQSKAYCIKSDAMVLDTLSDFLKDSDYELQDIIRICGIINVNAFSTLKSDFQGNCVRVVQCIYSQASLMAHSCIPNASWSIDVGTPEPKITIHATVPIRKGDMITIAYNIPGTMCGTLQRLISTEDVAHFVCKCRRCMDPTEMGSFVSAVKCFDCDTDYMFPKNPIDPESTWKCFTCPCTQNVEKIVLLLSQIQDALENIKRQRCSRETEMKKLETLLYRNEGLLLHENHYILQEIRMRIIKTQIHSLEDLTPNEIDRLIHHCEIMLRIADVLMPGFSRTRALLQFFISQGLIRKIELGDRYTTLQSQSHEENEEYAGVYKKINYLQTRALLFFNIQNAHHGSGIKGGGANQFVSCIQRQLNKFSVYVQ